ncbi:Zinc finger protein C25B8.19c [Trametes pubescens]|uniref:Zinc finger protein C25B8.19c n=1 Tax=Trametes pubescens TaxID=154538 RepID=A0A1M2VQ42_TRAPU|nr:Zinc finger protein C25B8.19c [Trametes pubescens]
MAALNLPTYVLSADECPPDDDRRHGCGICHRRFNRPSSLRIHMNSHTGDQPFECPYPGCSRRFSVNSNMRRHYRNHREGHTLTPPTSYQPLYYQDDQPHMLYRMHSSPSSSSSMSSFGDSDDRSDTPVIAPRDASRPYPITQGRTRSVSEVYPPAQARQGARSRACTVPGCSCDEAPAALRPAFQQGSASRPAPRSR